MRRISRHIILPILLLLPAYGLYAQDISQSDTGKSAFIRRVAFKINPNLVYVNFKDAIVNATDLFNTGEYDTCIAMIQHALRGWGSKMDQREALLEILVECYLEKDDLPNADRAMVRLFHNDPNYQVNDDGSNSEDFYKLANQYTIFPGLSIGVRNTELKSTYVTTKTYALPNNPGLDYTAPYTSNYIWYVMYYTWMEYEFRNNWSVNAEAIKYDIGYNRLLANSSTNYVSYNETMTIYRLPLYARRYGRIGRSFSCYAGLGFCFDKVTLGTAHTEYYDFPNSVVSNGVLDVTNIKNPIDISWLAAGGFGYTIKRIRLFLDARYYGGISDLVSSPNRNVNQVLQSSYHYIDGDVKLNQFEFGASAAIILTYKVKKK